VTQRPLAFWRDVDSSRREFGVKFWRTGAEFHIARRLYRVRWAWAK
jgi:hypothetical protein